MGQREVEEEKIHGKGERGAEAGGEEVGEMGTWEGKMGTQTGVLVTGKERVRGKEGEEEEGRGGLGIVVRVKGGGGGWMNDGEGGWAADTRQCLSGGGGEKAIMSLGRGKKWRKGRRCGATKVTFLCLEAFGAGRDRRPRHLEGDFQEGGEWGGMGGIGGVEVAGRGERWRFKEVEGGAGRGVFGGRDGGVDRVAGWGGEGVRKKMRVGGEGGRVGGGKGGGGGGGCTDREIEVGVRLLLHRRRMAMTMTMTMMMTTWTTVMMMLMMIYSFQRGSGVHPKRVQGWVLRVA